MIIKLTEKLGEMYLTSVLLEYLEHDDLLATDTDGRLYTKQRNHKDTFIGAYHGQQKDFEKFERLLSEANDAGESVYRTHMGEINYVDERVKIISLGYVQQREYHQEHLNISFEQYRALGCPKTIMAEQITICEKVN